MPSMMRSHQKDPPRPFGQGGSCFFRAQQDL